MISVMGIGIESRFSPACRTLAVLVKWRNFLIESHGLSFGARSRDPHQGRLISGLRRLRGLGICGRFTIVHPGAAGAIGPTAKAHATGADDSNKASRIADTGLAFRRCAASSCACTFRSTKAILISFSPFDSPEMQKRRLRSQKSNTRTKVQPSPSRDADF
jgi:hypothetical protein